MPLPKRSTKKTPPKTPDTIGEVTIINGVRVLGSTVRITCSASIKICQNYQTAGVDKSVEFVTPVEDTEKSLKGMNDLLRKAVSAELASLNAILAEATQ